jgi:hypothetical protein
MDREEAEEGTPPLPRRKKRTGQLPMAQKKRRDPNR